MNKSILIILTLIVVLGGVFILTAGDISQDTPSSETDSISVTPISHASLILNWGDKTIYVDPVGGGELYQDSPNPDLVFITHGHGDHFDIETLRSVVGSSTAVIVPETVANQLDDDIGALRVRSVENSVTSNEQNVGIDAVPMYNLPESQDAYHVKGVGNGYVLQKDGYRVYIAGDTSGIPEMRSLEDIDMAFVPMNMPYTMEVDEAADAVLDFAPDRVYSYHYRNQDGTLSDVDRFKSLVESENNNIEVVLIDWYPNRD